MTGRRRLHPRIYLDHGEAYGNLGDDAMLLNAVRRIRERLGRCSFVLPVRPDCPVPDIGDCTMIPTPRMTMSAWVKGLRLLLLPSRLIRRGTPDAVWRLASLVMSKLPQAGRKWYGAVRALRDCDALYCVGAANMNEWARRGPLLMKWTLIRAARRMGRPVIVSSQAIGPFHSAWTLGKTIEAVRMANHFSFRDRNGSLRILDEAGLDTDGYPEVGDEAFTLPAADVSRARDWLRAAGVDAERAFAVVHFRATDYTRRTALHYPKMAAVLDRLCTRTQVAFLPMSRGFHSPADARCAEDIRRHMAHPERLYVLECPTNPALARRLVGMARWVVALSYHVQVFAMAEATPMLLLVSGGYYAGKAAGLNAWADGRMPVADLDACSPGQICELVRDLERKRQQYQATLRSAARKMTAVNDRPVEALARCLETSSNKVGHAE